MSDIKQHYEVLGLTTGASPAEVKQAYRDLAKTWHPDRFAHDVQLKQQAEEKIKAINEAYQQLKAYQPVAEQQPSTESEQTRVAVKVTNAETYYNFGAEAVKAGRYKEALEDFSTAIRLNPDYAEAYRYRGFVQSLLGFELCAEADLAKAAKLGLLRTRAPRPSEPSASKTHGSNAKTEVKTERHTPVPPVPAPSTRTTVEQRSPSQAPWHCVKTLQEHSDIISTIAVSRDGMLASGSWDATIQLWNLRTGKYVCAFEGHTAPVWSVAFSADGQLLASGSKDETIKLWHLQTGTLLHTLTGHSGGVKSIALSPDKLTLVSGSWDGTVKCWDLSTGKLIRTLSGQIAPVWSVAISPDGTMLLSGSEDSTAQFYHLRTGEPLKTLTGHSKAVFTVAISPDSRQFASGGNDCEVRLWSTIANHPNRTLLGHTSSIRTVAFSPDGQTLASGSEDQTIKLWSVNTGDLFGTLTGHTGAITSLAYSPDGQTLMSSSFDQTIKFWQRP
jgi:hypothetical protein